MREEGLSVHIEPQPLPADGGYAADPGLEEVVGQSQDGGTLGVGAFLDGDDVGQDGDLEGVVGDVLGTGDPAAASRPGELLEGTGGVATGATGLRHGYVTMQHGE